MKDYSELDHKGKMEVLDRGLKYYKANKEAILALGEGITARETPENTMLPYPDTWKGTHWNWFYMEVLELVLYKKPF